MLRFRQRGDAFGGVPQRQQLAPIRQVHKAKGKLLMKGSLHTDELMRSVTAKSTGLRTDRRISHVFAIDVPGYAQTLFITDAAINIFPDLAGLRQCHRPRSRAKWSLVMLDSLEENGASRARKAAG